MPPPQSLSTEKKRKRVRFREPDHIGATEEPEDSILESSADSQGWDQRDASEPSGQAQIFMQDIWLVEWKAQYTECPRWGQAWKAIHNENETWPPGYKLLEKRLYFEEKLCVPYVLTEQIINGHHAFLGHIGGQDYKIISW